eukprot:TRINITY_DN5193_c0_g1_i1.p6 TRINITY_DN5193_c0_g1~~TRINITY_DN5193_c0_g1_i1.p6  ORF type:complete len:110 (+),score=0.59 TRINITY_DN5193_c0_g1_i1:631-960(+)
MVAQFPHIARQRGNLMLGMAHFYIDNMPYLSQNVPIRKYIYLFVQINETKLNIQQSQSQIICLFPNNSKIILTLNENGSFQRQPLLKHIFTRLFFLGGLVFFCYVSYSQ